MHIIIREAHPIEHGLRGALGLGLRDARAILVELLGGGGGLGGRGNCFRRGDSLDGESRHLSLAGPTWRGRGLKDWCRRVVGRRRCEGTRR